MLAIQLRFPAGRWHATPWGRQVNEGAVEWPPSPWRLLRSLIAVWRQKLPEVAEQPMRELIARLAAPPRFFLPPARLGHTRHFMPLYDGSRTKIFDTFVVIHKDDPLVVLWPELTLGDEQADLLRRLLDATSYFGRAESWICGELAVQWQGEPNAIPVEDGTASPDGMELVHVLGASDEPSHKAWHEQVGAELRERRLREAQAKASMCKKPVGRTKLSARDEAAIEAIFPPTVFDALHADTDALRRAGWNQPPGSRWITYGRPENAFAPPPQRSAARKRPARPTVARFALSSSVRPRLTDALWIGERIRTAVMANSRHVLSGGTDAGNGDRSDQPDAIDAAAVFSGKQADGSRLQGGHQHAHFLCEAPSGDARIQHVTIFAPMGFTREDQIALSRLRGVWGKDRHDLQLVLLGVGDPADFGGQNERAGHSRILDQATHWISRTPVVLTRHLKIKRSERNDQRKHLAAVRRELEAYIRGELCRREWLRPYASGVRIEPRLVPEEAGTALGGRFTSWRTFRRRRQKGDGLNAGHEAYGFRLIFPEAVRGPIALGYGCHFGLGVFVPERKDER